MKESFLLPLNRHFSLSKFISNRYITVEEKRLTNVGIKLDKFDKKPEEVNAKE